MKFERVVWIALGLLTLVRIILGACVELTQDEAYYFMWAERLDWSYYSKGPGVALALTISTALFGDSELGIRILSPLLALTSSYLLFLLGKELVGRRAAIWAVVMLNLTPIFNAGAIILTIDPIMLAFWLAAMLTTWRALESPDSGLKWWLLTGLALGLGCLAKYTILAQLLSLALFIGVWKDRRKVLGQPGLYLMLAVTVLCTLPIWIWNAQNEWITFRHLKDHTESEGFPFRPDQFLEYLGIHLGVYSPLFFAGLMWALYIALRQFKADRKENYLACYSLPIVLGYFLLTFKSDGEVNWTAPGFFGLGLIFMKHWESLSWPKARKAWLARCGIGIAVAMTLWMANPDGLRALGVNWPYKNDPFLRLRGWETGAEAVAKQITHFREETGEMPFLIANRYQTAATISFYLPKDIEVLQPTPDYPKIHLVEPYLTEAELELERQGHRKIQNQFSFWPSYHEPGTGELFVGQNALFITDDLRTDGLPRAVRERFADSKMIGWFEVERRGELLRGWKIFACYDYQMRDRLGGGNE